MIDERPAMVDVDGNDLFANLHPPTIYTQQFWPDTGGKKGRGLSLTESMCGCVSGSRGSGKSETLTYIGISAMASGQKCWANYPITAKLVDGEGNEFLARSTPLNFDELFNLDPSFRGGVIIIDEYQDWDSNYDIRSTQSKVLHAMWAQIRKNDISFYYAAKKFRWVGIKTRDETDIEINCHDAAKTPAGFGKYQKGELINWTVWDESGNWTGKMADEYPVPYTFKFYAKPIWGAYDTRHRFDFWEAIQGIKIEKTKRIIDKANHDESYEQEDTELMERERHQSEKPSVAEARRYREEYMARLRQNGKG
jgi:hypothetical protein